MRRGMWCLATALIIFGFNNDFADATSHDFFKEKTIRIVVGLTPGGAADMYARTLARHMGKHIPGEPKLIVMNMPGAGSLIAANYVYNIAKPDGLTIGTFIGGLLMRQLLGQPGIQFDALKFEYLGSPDKNHPVCAFTKASGITSIEKWIASKKPAVVGSTGPGGFTHDLPMILKPTLGLPIQIVSGYKGPSEVALSLRRGELDGVCNSWQSLKVTSGEDIKAGELLVVVQAMPYAHPELPGIPLAVDLTRTDESRQVIEAVHNISITNRPYVLPPGTPKEQVHMLRRAFVDTMKDPQFVADSEQSKLDLDPLTGEEFERTVIRLLKMPPRSLAYLKEVMKR